MLRRCQSVMLLVALAVSSPLGWIGEQAGGRHAKCDGVCCPKRPRTLPGQTANRKAQGEDALCRRGAAGHWSICLTKSSQAGDFGVVAPLRPATLAKTVPKLDLQASHWSGPQEQDSPLSGFVRLPFQPPRSL